LKTWALLRGASAEPEAWTCAFEPNFEPLLFSFSSFSQGADGDEGQVGQVLDELPPPSGHDSDNCSCRGADASAIGHVPHESPPMALPQPCAGVGGCGVGHGLPLAQQPPLHPELLPAPCAAQGVLVEKLDVGVASQALPLATLFPGPAPVQLLLAGPLPTQAQLDLGGGVIDIPPQVPLGLGGCMAPSAGLSPQLPVHPPRGLGGCCRA